MRAEYDFWLRADGHRRNPGTTADVIAARHEAHFPRSVRYLLHSLGAQVTPARDGAEAVRLCLAQPAAFDVVLMDLHMPVLDGLAAVRALRRDARTAALPVVAFSAAPLEHERALARAAGMNGFLAKPMQPEELVQLLSGWVPQTAS